MKWLLYLIMLAMMITLVQAIDLDNNTWFAPSQATFSGGFIIFYTNQSMTGVSEVRVNETCVTINTTSFCNLTTNVDYLDVIRMWGANDTFYFNISEIGMEWIKAKWNNTGVTAEYSLDNATWYNISIITTTYGLQYALPANTIIYVRARNTSTDFGYDWVTTLFGGIDEMQLAIIIALSVLGLIFLVLGIFLFLHKREQ